MLRSKIILVLISAFLVIGTILLSLQHNQVPDEYDVNKLRLPVLSLPAQIFIKDNTLQPNSRAAMLSDPESNYKYFTFKEKENLPIASLTKIMTAVVALETYKPDDQLTINQGASEMPSSKIDLVAGEQLTAYDLIKAMLVNSANDAAMGLADGIGKDKFIDLMNAKARQLNLQNTKFYDPTGLDDRNISTADELATLTRYAMRKDTFRSFVRVKNDTIYSINKNYKHDIISTNLFYNQMIMPSAQGIKTGYTPESGRCFVGWFNIDNEELLTVVLSSSNEPYNSAFIETERLLKM